MRKVQLLGLALAGTTVSVFAFAQVMNLPPGTVVSFPDGAKIDLKLPAKPPELSLLVDPTEIEKGKLATLNWSAMNANSCVASNGWTGDKPVQGNETVSPQANATYSLSCSGDGGTISKDVALSVKEPTPPSAFQISASYTTPAAAIELPLLAKGTKPFPPQWTWAADQIVNQPRSATEADNLIPKIEQYRGGVLIATWTRFDSDTTTCITKDSTKWPTAAQPASSPAYIMKAAASGCGPFGNAASIDLMRFWLDGDVFKVYPAVYKNNLVVGDWHRDYYSDPVKHTPTDIKLIGVIENGIRPEILRDSYGIPNDFASAFAPVYIGPSVNLTIENIDVRKSAAGSVGKGGIYINGANGLTLRQMRVGDFALTNTKQIYGENGVFGTNGANKGTIVLDQVELFNNGGADGPAHNLYMGDGDYTIIMKNSWSHDVKIGQLFKARAHRVELYGNYFQGSLATDISTDNWQVDYPNGGELIVQDCIFTKNRSKGTTATSNGAAITFGTEGLNANIPQSIKIRNNTFVAFTLTYDGGHPIWPFYFRKAVVPVGGFATLEGLTNPVPVDVSDNFFVGYVDQTYSANLFMNYMGERYVRAAFSDIGQDFSLLNKIEPKDGGNIIGAPMYGHVTQGGILRKLSTIGAMD